MKMKIGYIRENDLKLNPLLLDDELREKATKWVEWANNADPSEYDPFHSKEGV